jgi:hypothetical protein
MPVIKGTREENEGHTVDTRIEEAKVKKGGTGGLAT